MTKKFIRTYKEYLQLYPNASYDKFFADTGGSKQNWYSTRYLLRKQKKLARAMLEAANEFVSGAEITPDTNPQPKVNQKHAEENESLNVKNTTDRANTEDRPSWIPDYISKNQERTSLGMTPDYIWYESTQIRATLNSVNVRFEHLVRVMEERAQENSHMLTQLLDANRKLKESNTELTKLLHVVTPKDK